MGKRDNVKDVGYTRISVEGGGGGGFIFLPYRRPSKLLSCTLRGMKRIINESFEFYIHSVHQEAGTSQRSAGLRLPSLKQRQNGGKVTFRFNLDVRFVSKFCRVKFNS